MTQKQTDYDKALKEDKAAFIRAKGKLTQNEEAIFDGAFLSGYHFGYYQQMEVVKNARQAAFDNHERNLIALGDEYMTARAEAFNESYFKFCESTKGLNVGLKCISAYQQGWNDADTFDALWALKHPTYLLNRLTHDHPEIIENEVKARMKDLENEKSDHFRDPAKMMRYEIAKECLYRLIETLSIDEPPHTDDLAQCRAMDAVALADALIKELEKEE